MYVSSGTNPASGSQARAVTAAETTGSARAAREADMAAEHCRSRRHLQRGGLSASMGPRIAIHPPSSAKGFAVSPIAPRLRRPRTAALLLVGLALVLCAPGPGRAQAAPAATPRPTIAVEDTLYMDLPEEIVRSPRVTIDEILRRVAEGEAHRDSLMDDQVFTMLAALTFLDSEKGPASPVVRQWESATRVYRKRPDKVRNVLLRQKSNFKSDNGATVTADASMGEELVTFAFSPRLRKKYKFTILERHLLGDHVVYVLGFTPKSKLDDLPTGKAWIDTNEFVIVRQEFWYRDHSPSRLVFKTIDNCVIERTKIDDKWWVMSRVFARVQVTSLARFLARVGKEKLTPTVDFSLATREWQINRGIDDS